MHDVVTCESCGTPITIGAWPFCPHGASPNISVIGDDIPGGIWIRHGIMNEDGTPKKYYTKSEMRKEAARRGLVQGGDGSNPYKPNTHRVYST